MTNTEATAALVGLATAAEDAAETAAGPVALAASATRCDLLARLMRLEQVSADDADTRTLLGLRAARLERRAQDLNRQRGKAA